MSHMTYALSCRLKHFCAFLLLAAGFLLPSYAETVPPTSGAWRCGIQYFEDFTYTTDPSVCFHYGMQTPYATNRSQYGSFWGENVYLGADPVELSGTQTRSVKLYYKRCEYPDKKQTSYPCPDYSPQRYLNAFFSWDSTVSSCPNSHPYETSNGQCSDLPTSCQDMDTMTEACCEDYSTGMCAAQGSELLSWERTGLGYTQCSWQCTQEPEEPEFDPQNEDECEQAAQASCAGSGGMYNYYWDNEYQSCAFSCNDAPEEPIDPNAPPTPDPSQEPKCTLDQTTGRYSGQCVDDDNPDNGECTENEDGTFEGQCVAGDGVSSNSLLKTANQHLLGIKGKIQGTNERLDELPEKMTEALGLGDPEQMASEWERGFMSEFDRPQSEVDSTGEWLRGVFGLGEERGLENLPVVDNDLSQHASGFTGAINGSGCPASKSVDLNGMAFGFSYASMCEFFHMIRPIVIAGAYFIAAFIVFGWRD